MDDQERVNEMRKFLRSDVAKNLINVNEVVPTNLTFPFSSGDQEEIKMASAKNGGFFKKNYDAEYNNK